MSISARMREGWIKQGLSFGYPPCCVALFPNSPIRDAMMLNPWYGTGFVPCPRCAANIERTDAFIRQHRNPAEEPWVGTILPGRQT